jgi:hypothetical protein
MTEQSLGLDGQTSAHGRIRAADAAVAADRLGIDPTSPIDGGRALDPETARTLVGMARAMYPHDKLPDIHYERVVAALDEKAAADERIKALLTEGVGWLATTTGRWPREFPSLPEAEQVAALTRLQETPFFQAVAAEVVVNLYGQHDVWPYFGYEGPSNDKGGYLHRGFEAGKRWERRTTSTTSGRRSTSSPGSTCAPTAAPTGWPRTSPTCPRGTPSASAARPCTGPAAVHGSSTTSSRRGRRTARSPARPCSTGRSASPTSSATTTGPRKTSVWPAPVAVPCTSRTTMRRYSSRARAGWATRRPRPDTTDRTQCRTTVGPRRFRTGSASRATSRGRSGPPSGPTCPRGKGRATRGAARGDGAAHRAR